MPSGSSDGHRKWWGLTPGIAATGEPDRVCPIFIIPQLLAAFERYHRLHIRRRCLPCLLLLCIVQPEAIFSGPVY